MPLNQNRDLKLNAGDFFGRVFAKNLKPRQGDKSVRVSGRESEGNRSKSWRVKQRKQKLRRIPLHQAQNGELVWRDVMTKKKYKTY
jgi:hypothetical protein